MSATLGMIRWATSFDLGATTMLLIMFAILLVQLILFPSLALWLLEARF